MKNKETLEEAAKIHLNSGKIPNDYQSFIQGAKSDAAKEYWFEKFQQEQDKKMYSEEEVKNIVEQTIEKFYKHRYVETKSEMKELWFEQFKKKLNN
jgi:hypothetical protein